MIKQNRILWVDDEIELLRSHVIFLSEKLSAGTSNFSSINLSALKIALHFVHLIILSAKVSKWPDACHTISGRTVGPSNSLNPFALKTFLTLFSTLFFNNLPIGP